MTLIQYKGMERLQPACSLIPETWRSPVEQEYFTVSGKNTHTRSKRQKMLHQSRHTTYDLLLLMFAISLDQTSELKAASLTPKFLITRRSRRVSELLPSRCRQACDCMHVCGCDSRTAGRAGQTNALRPENSSSCRRTENLQQLFCS